MIDLIRRQFFAFVDAAAHVVVVFDEPEFVTKAKDEEHAKRDQTQKRNLPVVSEDLDKTPKDDDYDCSLLLDPMVHLQILMANRKACPRFRDFVCGLIFREIKSALIVRKVQLGEESSFSFDGVDPDFGEREIGRKRRPIFVSTNPDFANFLREALPSERGI